MLPVGNFRCTTVDQNRLSRKSIASRASTSAHMLSKTQVELPGGTRTVTYLVLVQRLVLYLYMYRRFRTSVANFFGGLFLELQIVRFNWNRPYQIVKQIRKYFRTLIVTQKLLSIRETHLKTEIKTNFNTIEFIRTSEIFLKQTLLY